MRLTSLRGKSHAWMCYPMRGLEYIFWKHDWLNELVSIFNVYLRRSCKSKNEKKKENSLDTHTFLERNMFRGGIFRSFPRTIDSLPCIAQYAALQRMSLIEGDRSAAMTVTRLYQTIGVQATSNLWVIWSLGKKLNSVERNPVWYLFFFFRAYTSVLRSSRRRRFALEARFGETKGWSK